MISLGAAGLKLPKPVYSACRLNRVYAAAGVWSECCFAIDRNIINKKA